MDSSVCPADTLEPSASRAPTRPAQGCCTRWRGVSSTCTSPPCTSASTRSPSSTSPAAPPPPAPSTLRSRPSRAPSTPSAASRGVCGLWGQPGCAHRGSPAPLAQTCPLPQGGVREALRLRQCQEAEHQEPGAEGGISHTGLGSPLLVLTLLSPRIRVLFRLFFTSLFSPCPCRGKRSVRYPFLFVLLFLLWVQVSCAWPWWSLTNPVTPAWCARAPLTAITALPLSPGPEGGRRGHGCVCPLPCACPGLCSPRAVFQRGTQGAALIPSLRRE